MGKKETTTTPKQPKSIELKLLVPYALLTLIVASAVGFYFGWMQRSENISDVKAEAYALVKELKPRQ